jgi:predicted AlkP superfamily pyrophosphatase or phosphodiesterase
MATRSLLLMMFALLSLVSLHGQQKIRKAVFIIVDGIPADVIEKSPVKNMQAIAEVGGYSRLVVGGDAKTYNQTPTISAVGYNTVLTGVWANKHNVWDNDIADPNYNYPTIFTLFKKAKPEKKIGIFSTWIDNRLKLVGEGLPQTGVSKFDYVSDGYEVDTVNYPHDKKSMYIHWIDEKVAEDAAKSILTDAPDLSWVYLEYTDDMAHRFGDSPEFNQAIEYADGQVGRIWKAIREREKNFNEEWMIVVTTDHGRDAQTGKHHGGQSDREKSGWMITNYKGVNQRFTSGKGMHTDIMPGIANFLDIQIPMDVKREIDGVPFAGPVSISDAFVKYDSASHRATISWKALQSSGRVKIWVSTTNNKKTGGTDEYKLLKEVKLNDEKWTINLGSMPSPFYKFVLEAEHNSINYWIKK